MFVDEREHTPPLMHHYCSAVGWISATVNFSSKIPICAGIIGRGNKGVKPMSVKGVVSRGKKGQGILWWKGYPTAGGDKDMSDGKEDIFPRHSTCPGAIEIPTKREQKALSEMRRIKARVRALRERLKGLEGLDHSHEIQTVKNDLAVLKKEWNECEKRRKAAAKERMMLLGHE